MTQTPEQELDRIIGEMRTIQMVSGQCSIEGPEDTASLMAAAESDRARKWADALEALKPHHEALVQALRDLVNLSECNTKGVDFWDAARAVLTSVEGAK